MKKGLTVLLWFIVSGLSQAADIEIYKSIVN